MDENTEEHLEGFRQAVNNNQLYLAVQHLSEVITSLTDEVFKSKPEPKKVATKSRAKAPAKKTTPKKETDEEASE